MKHITKHAEPDFFTKWKHNDKMCQRGRPNWNRLKSEDKKKLRKTLLEEQGAICCYCGMTITIDNSHVEHFRPKSKNKYPQLQLEYDNLLCSCQLQLEKTEPRHCGNAKGSWFDEDMTVSPLNADCESRFDFLENGSIQSSDKNDEASKETVTHLALDIGKLRELRRAAIVSVLSSLLSENIIED
ncbi:retron system putative HNH endonuclease [Desulfobacterales bacterium HSG16]|nr:retron system putative HNH endonuclease [Desulfobacterales bacterium HSG16]